MGYSLSNFEGALIQSHLPSLCLLRPKVSFKATWSLDLPPNITTIPAAEPAVHKEAEWYTLAQGISPLSSILLQEKGAVSTFKHQQSHTGS